METKRIRQLRPQKLNRKVVFIVLILSPSTVASHINESSAIRFNIILKISASKNWTI